MESGNSDSRWNTAIFCSLPSSNTWKSSSFKDETGAPPLLVTVVKTLTSFTLTLNVVLGWSLPSVVVCCFGESGGWGTLRDCCFCASGGRGTLLCATASWPMQRTHHQAQLNAEITSSSRTATAARAEVRQVENISDRTRYAALRDRILADAENTPPGATQRRNHQQLAYRDGCPSGSPAG